MEGLHITTLTYKTVKSCAIRLDLYLPQGRQRLPILLRFHGGGLLQGSRTSVPPHLLRGIQSHGYALVSADYRLAPQVGVSSILEDVLDCIHYVRNDLSRESAVEKDVLDTSRLAIVGSSAGGYLGLLAGLYAVPKPNVVLAIYPITNPQGEFFLKPHPHPLGHIGRSEVADALDKDADVVSEDTNCGEGRRKMYFWMLQTASYADLVSVDADDLDLIVSSQVRKIGKIALPPTYICHGDADVLVDVGQSDEVVDAMRDVGLVHQYERLEGVDHLFDRDDSVSMAEMYAFMKQYL